MSITLFLLTVLIAPAEVALADEFVRYETRERSCVGITADGHAVQSGVTPDKCGAIQQYDWVDNGLCMAFGDNDKKKSLGVLWEDNSLCQKANPVVTYEVQGNFCVGLTADGKIGDRAATPNYCGKTVRYDWTPFGSCMGYGKENRPLGVAVMRDELCNRFNPIVKYEVHDGFCKGITKDNRMVVYSAGPTRCGRVATYKLQDEHCVGFSADGVALGRTLGSSECFGNVVRMEVRDRYCRSIKADNTAYEHQAHPSWCGRIHHYGWDQGSCMAYDAKNKQLGLMARGEKYCRKNLMAPPKPECDELESLKAKEETLRNRAAALQAEGNRMLKKSRNEAEYKEAVRIKTLYRKYASYARSAVNEVKAAQASCKKSADDKIEFGRVLKIAPNANSGGSKQEKKVEAEKVK